MFVAKNKHDENKDNVQNDDIIEGFLAHGYAFKCDENIIAPSSVN